MSTSSGITVTDNGPGLPPDVVAHILDFSIRVSSREAYISPSRGAQGNALKTLVAMPYVLDGETGHVEIDACGIRHEIVFAVDAIRQQPVIEHRQHHRSDGLVHPGTRVTVRWPDSACSLLTEARDRFVHLADDYAWLNPHLEITATWFGEVEVAHYRSCMDWQKWRPSDPTSPHWYTTQHLERLISAYIAHDEDAGRDRPVREFIGEFRGLRRSAAQKAVLDATGLTRAPLSALRNGTGIDRSMVAHLLRCMQMESAEVKPELLGVIGKEALEDRFDLHGCEMESFRYKRLTGVHDSIPWIVEAAFAWSPDDEEWCLVTGVNWSPGIVNPFRKIGGYGGLDGVLALQYIELGDPVCLFVHLASARVEYTDRGKSAIVAAEQLPIIEAVQDVTKAWRKQRLAEIKDHNAALRRRDAMTRTRRVTQKDAAYQVMEEAYLKASAGGTLPAKARQIMYAARPHILAATGIEKLDSAYFTQTLLPNFMTENPDLTADWKVVFDARGHFIEPHTERSVPLGTAEVASYLNRVGTPVWDEPSASMPDIETCGPSGCYGAVLFCEKEGFNELFSAVQLGERYDLAIMSTKGVSVTAARRLVDRLCHSYGIPLFVLHDFDVSGLTILRTLRADTRRYTFENAIEVIDLGLRLEDVRACALEDEAVTHDNPDALGARLVRDGASPEEIEFLKTRRVELNAFTSDALVEWIEGKLEEHGVAKVIPDDETLTEAYRRERQSAWLRDRFDELLEASYKAVEGLDIPTDLRKRVSAALDEDPELAWNQAVRSIAAGGGSGEQAE